MSIKPTRLRDFLRRLAEAAGGRKSRSSPGCSRRSRPEAEEASSSAARPWKSGGRPSRGFEPPEAIDLVRSAAPTMAPARLAGIVKTSRGNPGLLVQHVQGLSPGAGGAGLETSAPSASS